MSVAKSAPGRDQLIEENRELKRRLEAVTDQVARNDAKLKRSQQRELALLAAPDLASLFREMIEGLKASYRLEQVSVVLCDPDHDIRHLLGAGSSPTGDMPGLLLVDSLGGLAPQYVALSSPWLGPYAACDHQLIFADAGELSSIAMIPLAQAGKLMGSINLGSSDPQRFTSAHATDFLEHLGVIASYCVENTVNRARLLRSGFTDALTGWYNRRFLQVRLKDELARAKRDSTSLVCLMLDIDHFKRVNDTWGHLAGDLVLKELAQRVESQVRASDVAARYGGEEFVVLMPDTDVEAGRKLAERIRRAVAASPIELDNGEQLSLTVSVGIASTRVGNEDSDLKTAGESLIARADVALYSAKAAGRDCVIVEGDG